MDQSTALRKLESLLRMAEDTSSPNEAAIAARQARKIMDEHNLTAESVKESEKSGRFGTLPVDIGKGKSIPTAFWSIAWSVAELNDCLPWTTYKNGVKRIVFKGEHADCISAKLIFEYLISECNKQCKIAKDSDTSGVHGKTFNASFQYGFWTAIKFKVDDILKERRQKIDESTGTSLVVLKNELVKQKFPNVTYSGSTKFSVNSSSGVDAGYQAGMKTGINRQVGSSTKRLK